MADQKILPETRPALEVKGPTLTTSHGFPGRHYSSGYPVDGLPVAGRSPNQTGALWLDEDPSKCTFFTSRCPTIVPSTIFGRTPTSTAESSGEGFPTQAGTASTRQPSPQFEAHGGAAASGGEGGGCRRWRLRRGQHHNEKGNKNFIADALFKLPNGDMRAARNLKRGDQLCVAQSGFWETTTTVTACGLIRGEAQQLVRMETIDAQLTAMKSQRIWARRRKGDSSAIQARELNPGDVVWTSQGVPQPLISITNYTAHCDLANITFKPDVPVEAHPGLMQHIVLSKGDGPAIRSMSRHKKTHGWYPP